MAMIEDLAVVPLAKAKERETRLAAALIKVMEAARAGTIAGPEDLDDGSHPEVIYMTSVGTGEWGAQVFITDAELRLAKFYIEEERDASYRGVEVNAIKYVEIKNEKDV